MKRFIIVTLFILLGMTLSSCGSSHGVCDAYSNKHEAVDTADLSLN